MNARLIIPAILAAILVFVAMDAVYIVDETEQVVITQFGNPVGDPIVTPGLHIKKPFVQVAHFFDKRYLEWDGEPNQMPTREKQLIRVNTYARWRISDPLKYFESLGNELSAQKRINDILNGETQIAIARHGLAEVVRSTNRDRADIELDSDDENNVILARIAIGRTQISREILKSATARASDADLGIELLDLRFKRINYSDTVRQDVYARMIAERERIAARFLSEGQGEAARIRGEKERELQRIQSEGYREAEIIRGEGDAKATKIYADAYNRDPGFYSFLKTMETYEKTVNEDTILIMTTDAEFLKYMKDSTPKR